jgi:hypothetical protein
MIGRKISISKIIEFDIGYKKKKGFICEIRFGVDITTIMATSRRELKRSIIAYCNLIKS